eukprot:GHVS01067849.1.p1 GENE.GHVS01067849.1~~GHVS01067849.1.p1  ORF type:complete len:387 (+),score=80.90 GHVS01067849.1:70-1161(+)
MVDVTYGACCIDDLLATSLSADLLLHYGHSCLVPLHHTGVPSLYIFVDILFDFHHLVNCCLLNFSSPQTRLGLLSTVQYATALHLCASSLRANYAAVEVGREKPLSGGEVLGCTAPRLRWTGRRPVGAHLEDGGGNDSGSPLEGRVDFVVFVCDGRFHLEAALIQNPDIPFYRYDPFTKILSVETYAHSILHRNRLDAIEVASVAGSSNLVGLLLSTLGRQGSVGLLESLQRLISASGRQWVVVLMSEILPDTVKRLRGVDCFVQVGCPRLSIDWGHFYHKPLLSPYEAHVAFGKVPYQSVYPMDFYSISGGAWSNYGTDGHRNGSLASGDMTGDERKFRLRQKLLEKLKKKSATCVAYEMGS